MRGIGHFLQYLGYLFRAKNEHSIHAPFSYALYTNIIKDRKPYYIFSNIESLRSKLLLNQSSIMVTDHGTGNSEKRKISQIASNSLKKPKTAELLFRLVNHFKPRTVLEIGTSLGITTAYLASVNSDISVHTLEGCPEIAKIAQETFDTLKLDNINLITGPFDKTLDGAIEALPNLDFVFIDGNHKREPTIQYFEKCVQKANEKTVIVVDDIHWSGEMVEAWDEIKKSEKVTVSIDLFELGILIFDPKLEKREYTLRF